MHNKTMIGTLVLAAAMSVAPGCGVEENEADVVGQDLRPELSKRLVDARGELRVGTPATDSLSRQSGYHLYTFEGSQRWLVHFVLKSAAFAPHLRLITPSGRRLDAGATQDPNNGAFYAHIDQVLPETGTYQLLATSEQNLAQRRALAAGEYTLSAEADCGGIAGFQCPDYLECHIAETYPDAMGTCVTPAPRTCADLSGEACTADPRCELVPWGCDGNQCDPDTGVCHPCDPILVCQDKKTAGQVGDSCGSRGMLPCAEDLYCDFSLDAQCGAADWPGTCKAKPQACIDLYKPVCGCDGVTYSNSCVAASYGVSVQSEGACTPPPGQIGDACGSRGLQACAEGLYCEYGAGAGCGWTDAGGTCQAMPQYCTMQYDPVCGCDGVTYGNACGAASAGVSVQYKGACRGTN